MKGSVLRAMRDYGWEVPDPNGAGHTYFAAMEADGAVGSPACVPAPNPVVLRRLSGFRVVHDWAAFFPYSVRTT
jgi:hypothetical protein